MDNQILPQIDLAVLQEKANEYAMKGAIECIKEYYSGYNSPFKKAIETELSRKDIDSGSINLPDIMALINDQLTKEIDVIANTAVAKSFVPLVNRFLGRAESEIKFSDLLKEFIEGSNQEDYYRFDVSVEENIKYGWLDVKITDGKNDFSLTLHEDFESKKKGIKNYIILSLPYNYEGKINPIKLTVGEGSEKVTLEMPFTTRVLEDKFVSYIAKLVIARTSIEIDCREFEEEWFHDEDGCHCH